MSDHLLSRARSSTILACLSLQGVTQRHVDELAASCPDHFNFHANSNYCCRSSHLYLAIATSHFFIHFKLPDPIITNQQGQAQEASHQSCPRQKGYCSVYHRHHSSMSATLCCMHRRNPCQNQHDLTCQTVESIERTGQSWGSGARFQAHSDLFKTVDGQMSPSYRFNFGHYN